MIHSNFDIHNFVIILKFIPCLVFIGAKFITFISVFFSLSLSFYQFLMHHQSPRNRYSDFGEKQFHPHLVIYSMNWCACWSTITKGTNPHYFQDKKNRNDRNGCVCVFCERLGNLLHLPRTQRNVNQPYHSGEIEMHLNCDYGDLKRSMEEFSMQN